MIGLMANAARHEPDAVAALRAGREDRMNRLLRLPLPEPYVPSRVEALRDRLRTKPAETPPGPQTGQASPNRHARQDRQSRPIGTAGVAPRGAPGHRHRPSRRARRARKPGRPSGPHGVQGIMEAPRSAGRPAPHRAAYAARERPVGTAPAQWKVSVTGEFSGVGGGRRGTTRAVRSMSNTAMSVVLAGGGTAGHVEPAMAVADALTALDPAVRIAALGTARGLETRLVPDRGYRAAN